VDLNDETDLRDFAEEIRIMSSIAHPNLLSLYGISFSSDFADVILLTTLMENGSLADVLFKKHKQFNGEEKIRILQEISFGIHYLHSIRPRVIHRDLKSDNILLTRNYSVKIADFGMSKMIQEQSKIMTRSGTPHYMAPECIQEGKFSEKSDIYSFGIVVWELYAEERPYNDISSPYQIMYRVVHENLRPITPDGCPQLIANLIQACTDADASQRPSFKQNILQFNQQKIL